MLSIGQFADKAQVSTRTIRYYESIGLLPASSRGENNYRHYDQSLIARIHRIRDLQSLGFSLEEIKSIVCFSNADLKMKLEQRLSEIIIEIEDLLERQKKVNEFLSVTQKIENGVPVTPTERNLFMEALKQEVLLGLKSKSNSINDTTMTYLSRDGLITGHPKIKDYFEAIKACFAFAQKNNLKLGTARGSASASLTLYGLGLSGIDPLKYDMIPERLATQAPFFHIDVEFERGQEFVDFCREQNKSLTVGEIQAFKMPLIDIVKNVQTSIGYSIDFNAISDESDVVLSNFKTADIEKIFQFDFSKDSLVMNYERFLPEFLGLEKISEYLQDIKIKSFRDIINITALWRPFCKEMIDRIELYRKANNQTHSYDCLTKELNTELAANHGAILYHEDLIKIISHYSGWDFARSNQLRRLCFNKKNFSNLEQFPDWVEFKNLAPKNVVDLIQEESKWSFCLPHAISFAQFTKQTSILKSLHKKTYFNEIDLFEQKHGVTWDDIGIRMKGVSLHQS